MQPYISVIVPIYNVESYLMSCLDSLLDQTFKDFEVIMVDDGSKDLSGAIADRYAKKDARFKVIHQENKGLSGARNTGLKHAKGLYVSFLDSDDYFHPDFLKLMFQTAENEQSDIVFCKLQHTTEKYTGDLKPINPNTIKTKRYFKPFVDFLTHKELITQVCVKLYKRETLGNLTFKDGIYFEDVLFTTLFMGKAKSATFIDVPLYYYMASDNSIMRTSFNEKKVMSYVTVIDEIYHYTQQKYPDYLELVRKNILNKRVKMTMNQAVRKQKDVRACIALFELMSREFTRLYEEDVISFSGLKPRHKMGLALLIKGNYKMAWALMSVLS